MPHRAAVLDPGGRPRVSRYVRRAGDARGRPGVSQMIARRVLRRVLPETLSLRVRREWLARRIVAGRAYIENDVPLLPRYVKPTDVCWDIGANTGTYTLHLSRLARQVFAFEPVPHNLDILRDVKRRAGLENVTI